MELGNENSGGLPSGYREVKASSTKITLHPGNFFWLKDDYPVNLSEVILDDGSRFYIGSAVGADTDLVKLASQVDDKCHEDNGNSEFYRDVRRVIQREANANNLTAPRSTENIYYSKTNRSNGPRAYYTVLWHEKDCPVVIKLAVCCKNDERKVYSKISAAPLRG